MSPSCDLKTSSPNVLMRPYYLYFSILWLLVAVESFAMPEAPPPHSLSPTLNGLNISSMVKKDRVKIMLYVVNHEAFPVVCDAQYSSGPEKQDAADITFPPGKADVFRFNYGRNGDKVLLELICVNPAKNTSTENPIDDAL